MSWGEGGDLMSGGLLALTITALWLGFFHTCVGPDHYLPFVVLKRARSWSALRTLVVVVVCGMGHVLSSIAIGLFGIWAGKELGILESIEGSRGEWAARGLFAFGVVYLVYGIWAAIRKKSHSHHHFHEDGTKHVHVHSHESSHAHVHEDKSKRLTPWVLFIIFVLGPCEPLIPLLIFPAAEIGMGGVLLVSAAFAVSTVGTMVLMTALLSYGVSLLPLHRIERFVPAMAGGAIAFSGALILFFGF